MPTADGDTRRSLERLRETAGGMLFLLACLAAYSLWTHSDQILNAGAKRIIWWWEGHPMYQEKTLETWISRLADHDRETCLSGIRAVLAIGPKADRAVPSLVHLLERPDPLIRQRAAQALGQIGLRADAAVPSLADAFGREKDPATRAVIEAAHDRIKVSVFADDIIRSQKAQGQAISEAEATKLAQERLNPIQSGLSNFTDAVDRLLAKDVVRARKSEREVRPSTGTSQP